MQPSDDDYKQMGYVPVHDGFPGEAPPAGKHYEYDCWEASDEEVVHRYVLVDDPSPTLDDYDIAMERHLRQEREERGYTTREPDSYF